MKVEPQRFPETISSRRQFTSPELIDHDYWNFQSVQSEDKENEEKLSVYENNMNDVANGGMSILMVDHTANEGRTPQLELHVECDNP